MKRIYHVAMIAGLAIASVAASGAAMACVGTTAYPAAAKALDQSTLSAEKKAALMGKFNQGYATHEKGHAENNMSLMRDSLKTLGEVKAEMSK